MHETARPVLSGQVAIVTGGGAGIGSALSTTLGALGASVVVCGRRPEPLHRVAETIRQANGTAEPINCDITDLRSVERMASQVLERFGRADILVNNAGIGSFSTTLHELPPEEWETVMNTNLRGVYYCIRAFAPAMIKARSGHIINISSIASKNALPKGAVYAASKWGLNGLSYSVAEELRAYGIRVSVVCPGSTVSDLSPHAGRDPNKMLKPEDIAHVVAMLVTQAPQSFASEVVIRPTMKP
jgi:NAD(P)-dependent dehydrogenase (short-subunit alcohol dehydrogenase family)